MRDPPAPLPRRARVERGDDPGSGTEIGDTQLGERAGARGSSRPSGPSESVRSRYATTCRPSPHPIRRTPSASTSARSCRLRRRKRGQSISGRKRASARWRGASRRQDVGVAVGPAHAAAGAAGCQVGPLHVAEVLVVEGLGERVPPFLEAVDRPVLAVEERPAVADLGQRLAHEPAHGQRRRDGVAPGSSMVPCS